MNAVFIAVNYPTWIQSYLGDWYIWIALAFVIVSYLYALGETCPICGADAYRMVGGRLLVPRCSCSGCNRSHLRRITFHRRLKSGQMLSARERFDRLHYWKAKFSDDRTQKLRPIWQSLWLQFTPAMRLALLFVFALPVAALIIILTS